MGVLNDNSGDDILIPLTESMQSTQSNTSLSHKEVQDNLEEQMEELAVLPEPAPHKKFIFNVMVSGESGTGKTTFLNTFFPSMVEERVDLDFPLTTTINVLPEVEIKTEKGSSFYVRPVDTPGYGNSMDANGRISEIEAFQMDLMNSYDGTAPISQDKRIHICFYFIAAHRLKEIDIEFMKRLAPLVNIIPVIAKADSMTQEEKKHFTQLIEDRLEKEKIPVYSLGEKSGKKVYSIISSTTKDHKRVYAWGTADVNNKSHSDVLVLRELIIQEQFCEVFLETNRKTNSFMKRNLVSRKVAVAYKRNVELLRYMTVVMLFFTLFGLCYAFSVWMLQEEFKPFELPAEEVSPSWCSFLPNVKLPELQLPHFELPQIEFPSFEMPTLPSFKVLPSWFD